MAAGPGFGSFSPSEAQVDGGQAGENSKHHGQGKHPENQGHPGRHLLAVLFGYGEDSDLRQAV